MVRNEPKTPPLFNDRKSLARSPISFALRLTSTVRQGMIASLAMIQALPLPDDENLVLPLIRKAQFLSSHT
jgi:hypothetical protein